MIKQSYRLLKMSFKHSTGLTIAVVIGRLVKGLMPMLQLVALGHLVNTVISAYNQEESLNALWMSMGIFLVVYAVGHLMNRMSAYIENKHQLAFNASIETQLLKKQTLIPYEYFEHPDTAGMMNRVAEEGVTKINEGFYHLLSLLDYGIQMMGMVVVIATQSMWISLITALIFIGLLPIAKRCGVEDYKAFQEASEWFRRSKYLRQVLTSRDHVEERTLFGYGPKVNALWENQYQRARTVQSTATRKNYIKLKGASIATALIAFVIALLLAYPLSTGLMSSGLYIALVGHLFKMVHMMSWEFGQLLEDFISCLYYQNEFDAFMAIEETAFQGLNDVKMPFEKIVFNQVSFRYGNGAYVLKNLSFVIENGKHYAFVGENGAGKSTLIKLLLGLYETYEGEILVDGFELRTLSATAKQKLYSVVFQDFTNYQLTLAENLCLGSEERPSEERLSEVLSLLQLETIVNQLSSGLQTPLGKLTKEGMDLSGGQWQKIAIARALLKDAAIHIKDEPSAALDPIYEADLYRMFNRFFKERCTILITHRLGAVVSADVIYVLKEGTIIEEGTHDALMVEKGLYRQLYDIQKEWYVA